MQPETRYAWLGQDRIAYRVLGKGPRDLVMTGAEAIDVAWEDPGVALFLGSLASFSRLILFDRRGTGASDPPPPDPLRSADGLDLLVGPIDGLLGVAGISPDPEMQIDPVALQLDVVQLDLAVLVAVLVAAGLHGQQLGVSQEPLQGSKHVSYRHPSRGANRAVQAALSPRERPPPTSMRHRLREWPPRANFNETAPRERP